MRISRSSLNGFTPAQQSIQQMIIASALAKGVNPSLALAIAAHESQFDPNAKNCANANGTCDAGVMQINQTNWSALGLSNPYDPQANIDAGVSMLKTLDAKYQGNESQILCAYQYGPGRCSDPNNLPSLTPSFVAYVDNWIAQNADTLGLPAADPAGASLSDSTVNLAGYDIPLPTVLLGAGAIILGLWYFMR